VVIGISLLEREKQSMLREQQLDATLAVQRIQEPRAAISYPIISRQLLSIPQVVSRNFILSASIAAVPKEEK
jgi:hypothetical protein